MLTYILLIFIIIAFGLLLTYLLTTMRRKALKSGAQIGISMTMLAILSVFRSNIPKNGKKNSLKKDSQKSGDDLD